MIEDSYPLSSLQRGLLFNSLRSQRPGVEVAQLVCRMREALDPHALEQAWNRVVARHAALRTGIRWDATGSLLQEVHRTALVPMEQGDWRAHPAQQQRELLERYLRADRMRPFQLDVPPLLRLACFRLGEADYHCVLTAHHVVMDGRSLLIALDEAFGRYDALLEGREVELPPARPYREFVAWQQRQDATGHEAYWRDLLRGYVEPVSVAAFGVAAAPAGADPGTGHDERDVWLSVEVSTALRGLARARGLTLNTFVQAAWALLLARYSGRPDVVFGATRSIRRGTVAGVDDMVGLFLNTLPVRVGVPRGMPLRDWLDGLRAQAITVRDRQHTPLTQVLQWSEVPPGVPLFDSIIVFENFLLDRRLRSRGGAWSRREFTLRRQPGYPVVLYGFDEPRLLLKLIYDPGALESATAGRLLGNLERLLAGMAADPDRPLGALPMLGAAEERRQVVEWNATDHPRPEAGVHELFEAQAARRPEALAVRQGERRLSYRELDASADRLAGRLRSLGVGPEARVGIWLERSPDVVVAQLAVLKAGAAFVPLDPDHPAERVAAVLADSGIQVAITERRLRERLPAAGVEVVALDEAPVPSSHPTRTEPRQWVGTALAYVIYTSGSTGQPKGVACQHGGLSNLVTAQAEHFRLRAEDRVSQIANPVFDVSVWEIWLALTTGASLHMPDEETLLVPARLAEWLCAEGITIGFLPTGLGEVVLAKPWPAACRLRALVVAGDRLHPVAARDLPFELWNYYGPTECTVYATGARVEPGAEDLPAIGRPLPNTRAYALDEWLAPVPIGAAGELHVGGAGLARGYLHRPDLTAERFVPDPFGPEPGGRLYRTGDVVRYRPDGDLEFLGRRDQQVKLRGLRVELGEVEAALRRCPGVREAAVVLEAGPGVDPALVGHVAADDGVQTEGALRAELRHRLPAYMIPLRIVLWPRLPLTPNGKVDRGRLTAPDAGAAPARAVGATSTAELVRAAWAATLQRPDFAPDDGFFDLGGHSMLALRMSIDLSEALGREVPVEAILEAPRFADFVDLVDRVYQDRD
ncbi:MAG TPA: amino acid adenylation domain-containing protein [Candidatus Dormibacteraeota bacterium]|nr:amino acid adenylation domain-containing protein [Candidatus Dormibacteraeota bacterium]